MKKFIYLFILFIFITINSFAQMLEDVRTKYESFDYDEVIKLANIILVDDTTLSVEEKIELLTMKGISFYSLSNVDSSRASFIDLLKLESDHELDPVRTSPKIISFFNTIKNEFLEITTAAANLENETKIQEDIVVFDSDLFTNSVVRSLFLPGLGHLYAENSGGNWLLTTISTLNLGSMIYFIIETNNKEKLYLNESDLTKMATKYNQYNNSYKTRNILIGTFTALWLYSQIDLLFNSSGLFSKRITPSVAIEKLHSVPQYSLRISVPF